jgi:hypothetical protein
MSEVDQQKVLDQDAVPVPARDDSLLRRVMSTEQALIDLRRDVALKQGQQSDNVIDLRASLLESETRWKELHAQLAECGRLLKQQDEAIDQAWLALRNQRGLTLILLNALGREAAINAARLQANMLDGAECIWHIGQMDGPTQQQLQEAIGGTAVELGQSGPSDPSSQHGPLPAEITTAIRCVGVD